MKKNDKVNDTNDIEVSNINDVLDTSTLRKGNNKTSDKPNNSTDKPNNSTDKPNKPKLSRLEQLAKRCPPDLYEKLADKTYIGENNPRLIYPEVYDPDKPIPVRTEGDKPITNPNNFLLFRKLENNLDLSGLAQPSPKTIEMLDVIKRQIQLTTESTLIPAYNRRFSTAQELLDFFSQWLILCGDVGLVPNIRLFCACAGIPYNTFINWYRNGTCTLEMQKACATILGWLNASEETMAVAGQLDSRIYQFHAQNRADMYSNRTEATVHSVVETEITPEEIAARLPEL